MITQFDERTWLTWLTKVRIIIITFVLGIELAVANLLPNNLPTRLFIILIVLWYTIAAFYALLVTLSRDTRNQSLLQVLSDLGFASGIVYLTGSYDSSFHFLYPLIIIVASILLPSALSYIIAGLAFICYGAILELSYFDVIRSYSLGRPELKTLQFVILVNLFAYLAIAYLSSLLSAKLRLAGVQLQSKSGALQNLQALHENIIQSVSGGLITTGLDGEISFINASAERLLETRSAEVVGRSVQNLFLDLLPEGVATTRAEVRAVTRAGTQKTFSLITSVLSVPDQGAIGYVYTFDDLTEIRRLEREVRLRDRLSALGRMASGIAHEIRNPLSSIAGSVKVLSELSPLNPEQQTLVGIVTRESERLNKIISDFLTYTREKQYRFEQVDLVVLLEDTLTLLANHPKVAGMKSGDAGSSARSTLRIAKRFEAASAPAIVDGDRIKQVFWNICDNAVRAMPEGGALTVSLSAADDNWRISFADTGPGIDPQQIEKIFEPFQSQFEGGTGLGLAIVYQIIQAHDGSVGVVSELGKGCEFVLELRRAGGGPSSRHDRAANASPAGEKVLHG